jgi:hypothetical protein
MVPPTMKVIQRKTDPLPVSTREAGPRGNRCVTDARVIVDRRTGLRLRNPRGLQLPTLRC